LTNSLRDGLNARLRSRPERQQPRSPGALRFTRLPAGHLIAPAALAVAALVAGAGVNAHADTRGQRQQSAVAPTSQAVASELQGVIARERFITEASSELAVGDAAAASADAQPAGPVLTDAARITGLAVTLPSLAALTADQDARIGQLASAAEARAADAERAIRRVGLNPGLVLAKLDGRAGQGGPLEALTQSGQPLEPQLASLAASVARMNHLEHGLDTLPTRAPATVPFVSSSFGLRTDPFTGEVAMHAGLDFPGPVGTPIHAAADGVVTFAGSKGGYGNCIEVTHANGLMTRYGHMSAFKAHVGEKVLGGETIGAIGSTGRSTGPHLHFEVRVNGAAVNPRTFLEARA
jgi:murein DD-endopeptidase MepM/ murein hydrolase activator NlpD